MGRGATGRQPPAAASLGARIVARAIDWALLTLPLMFVATQSASADQSIADFLRRPSTVVVALAVDFLYEAGLVARYGQTLGKRVMRIRVEAVDGTPARWRALPRWGVLFLPSLFPDVIGSALFLALLCWVALDRGRGPHDRAVGTRVVKVRRPRPSPEPRRTGAGPRPAKRR